MYAVIRTGGKQYKVAPQDVLQIEKIDGAAGEAVQFADVLMVGGEGEPVFGLPAVSGATVSAEVVEQGRGPKVIIFKKKRRQNYRRKRGHRQELTTVRILEILTADNAPSKSAKKADGEKKGETAAAGPVHGESAGETKAAKPRAKKADADAEAVSAKPEADDAATGDTAPKKPRTKKAE
jgi:large subunit ribosomal protein L21